MAPPSAEYDFISSEYGIHIDYLDQEKLKKLVTEGVQDGGLPDGILQQYVRPFCEANIIYLCTWKPFFFYVSRITNESAGKTPEVRALMMIMRTSIMSPFPAFPPPYSTVCLGFRVPVNPDRSQIPDVSP